LGNQTRVHPVASIRSGGVYPCFLFTQKQGGDIDMGNSTRIYNRFEWWVNRRLRLRILCPLSGQEVTSQTSWKQPMNDCPEPL